MNTFISVGVHVCVLKNNKQHSKLLSFLKPYTKFKHKIQTCTDFSVEPPDSPDPCEDAVQQPSEHYIQQSTVNNYIKKLQYCTIVSFSYMQNNSGILTFNTIVLFPGSLCDCVTYTRILFLQKVQDFFCKELDVQCDEIPQEKSQKSPATIF